MPTMICQKCGKECERTSNVQKYCPECRKKKQVERNATYQQKRENTPDFEKIGKSNFLRRLFCGTFPTAEEAKKD